MGKPHVIADENGEDTAWVHDASDESVGIVLQALAETEDGRSSFQWLRLRNGDLMLGVFPRGKTYFAVERDAAYPETEVIMGNREKNLGRRILFTAEDFEPLFEEEGIDFLTLTDSEWRSFVNMFRGGTSWSEVVKDAAWTIKLDREKNMYR